MGAIARKMREEDSVPLEGELGVVVGGREAGRTKVTHVFPMPVWTSVTQEIHMRNLKKAFQRNGGEWFRSLLSIVSGDWVSC